MQDPNSKQHPAMSVGMMTFHWAHNYGAILQTYALYHYLNNALCLEARLIDFTTDRQKKINRILPKIRYGMQFPKSIGLFLAKLFHYRLLKRRQSRFELFLRDCFTSTKRYTCFEDLNSVPPTFDATITGSDQVFNYRILPEKELLAYCLAPFQSGKTRKIAFAPSFGNDSIPSEVQYRMDGYLKDFKHLSARETEGALILEAMTGKHVQTLLDPVFLLSAGAWKTLSRPVENIPSTYILCYALNGRHSLGALATKLKTLTGLPIVLVTANVRSGIKAARIVYDAGPREFLWLIENARHVVTDSFHGTVFSTLFEKAFFAHIITQQSAQRIVGLLKRFGLENRLAQLPEDITLENLSLDFSCVNLSITKGRDVSISFLKEALFNPVP
jgi:hypothetical protein